MSSTTSNPLKAAWATVEFKLILAWLAVIFITAVFDPNHTYWNNPLEAAENILHYALILGLFALGMLS